MPSGTKVESSVPGRLAAALSSVDLLDVRPRAEVDLPAAVNRATVTTFDGVTVVVTFAKVGDANWALFEARYVPPKDKDAEAAEEARARVAEINDRVGKWIYQIPEYVAARLKITRKEAFVPDKPTS